MYVDSHCHLDLITDTTFGDLDAVINHAEQHQLQHMLSVSITLDRFPALQAQAARYPNVSISCGLHPTEQPGDVAVDVDSLASLATAEDVVAIGETGLDYYRCESADIEWQQTRFRHHIQVAKLLNKPLIIHTRAAKEDTLKILKEEGAETVGGVFHSFCEDLRTAQVALDMNFYVSFSGIVTFKNAQPLQSVASQLPLDRLLIETDSPFLAPVPVRGKPNFPFYVAHVADKIANLKQIDIAEVAATTTDNYFNCFSHSTRSCSLP